MVTATMLSMRFDTAKAPPPSSPEIFNAAKFHAGKVTRATTELATVQTALIARDPPAI